MTYNIVKGFETLYPGNSFTVAIYKDDGSTWAANETGFFEVYDKAGINVANGAMVKGDSDLALVAMVPNSATSTWIGPYLVTASLTDTVDTEKRELLAEYLLTYKSKKAPYVCIT